MATVETRFTTSGVSETVGACGSVAKGFTSVSSTAGSMASSLDYIKASFYTLGGAWASSKFIEGIVSGFKYGIQVVDDFVMSVSRVAAMVISLGGYDTGNLAKDYAQAEKYAEGIYVALQKVDANTSLNIGNLQTINEEMVKQGVYLDANNKAQVEGYTRMANAVAVYSNNGKMEAQVRQEAASALRGEVNIQSQLASMLQNTVKGPLDQWVKKHKEAGDLIEAIGDKLKGFGPSAERISGSWSAASSSMKTSFDVIMKSGFDLIFKDVVSYLGQANEGLRDHKDLIAGDIQAGWERVKGVASDLAPAITIFGSLLSVTILPLLQEMLTLVEGSAKAINLIATFQFKESGVSEFGGAFLALGIAAYGAVGGMAALTLAYNGFMLAVTASRATNPVGWFAAALTLCVLAAKPLSQWLDKLLQDYSGLTAATEKDTEATNRWNAARMKAAWMRDEGGLAISPALAAAIPAQILPPKNTTKPDPKKEEEAERLRKQWAATYADLRKETAALNPAMDESARKIADANNKYTDLEGKKGANLVLLKQLRSEHLAGIETRHLMIDAIAQNKKELDEYTASAEATAAFEKSYWQDQADALKALDVIKAQQIERDIAAVNAQEKFYQITTGDAAQKRIDLLQQELTLQQQIFDDIKDNENTANLLRGQTAVKIQDITAKLLEQQIILRDRSAIGGMTNASKRYQDMVGDTGRQMDEAFTGAIYKTEDAITNSIDKMKLNFKSLFSFIQQEAIRISIARPITNYISGGVQSMISWMNDSGMKKGEIGGTSNTDGSTTPGSGGNATNTASNSNWIVGLVVGVATLYTAAVDADKARRKEAADALRAAEAVNKSILSGKMALTGDVNKSQVMNLEADQAARAAAYYKQLDLSTSMNGEAVTNALNGSTLANIKNGTDRSKGAYTPDAAWLSEIQRLRDAWVAQDEVFALEAKQLKLKQEQTTNNLLLTEMELKGQKDSAEYIKKLADVREAEMFGMNNSDQLIQRRIYLLQDEAAAVAKVTEAQKTNNGIMRQLLSSYGDASIELQRQLELSDITDESTKAVKQYVWAMQDQIKAQQEATAVAKAAALETIGQVQSILQAKRALLGDSSLSPEAAYNQAKASFDNSSAENVAANVTAFMEASKNYNASGAAFQADKLAALAKLDSFGGGTANTVVTIDAQLVLLEKIAKAVGDSDGALVSSLSAAWLDAQVQTGLADGYIKKAISDLQATLNTQIVTGTAKQYIAMGIADLNTTFNSGVVTGSAKYYLAQGIADLNSVYNSGVVTGTAKVALGQQISDLQTTFNTGVVNGTSKTYLASGIKDLNTTFNTGVVTGTAKGFLTTGINDLQTTLNTQITTGTAAGLLARDFGSVNTTLNNGLNNGSTSVLGMVNTFSATLAASAETTRRGLLNFTDALAIVSNYTSQKTAADAARGVISGAYRAGTISLAEANSQFANTPEVLALQRTITAGQALGLTSLTMGTTAATNAQDDDARMKNKAGRIAQDALMMGVGLMAQNPLYDVDKNGAVTIGDALRWQQISLGETLWSSLDLPAFANGGITDGPSIAGEGTYREAVIPLLDGKTVRARIDGQADNKGVEERLDKAVRALESLERKLGTIEEKARLKANA